MDFNSANKSNVKRKAQSIQDMINSPSPGGRGGIGRSGYQGPKKGPDVSSSSSQLGGVSSRPSASSFSLNGINVNSAASANRWGNSNEGMPVEKRPRVKSDVPNPMRGNIFKKDTKEPGMKTSIAGSGSSYSGPKKSIDPATFLENATNSLDAANNENDGENQGRRRSSYVAKSYSTPMDDYGFPIFYGLLMLAVCITLLVSGLKPRNKTYTYPLNIFSMTGVINTAYEHSLGFAPTKSLEDDYSLSASSESTSDENEEGKKTVEAAGEGDLNVLGDDAKAVELDDGSKDFPGYGQAADHTELVSQIETALAANDFEFVGAKIAYEDENTGSLNGYPLSLIKHFCTYMSTNSDKRSSFVSTIGSDEYAGTNGTANVIKLPIMKFTVKMGESTDTFVLDNTIVSVSGFSDVIVNGNQQAAIYPLLPCMYTVTLTNNAWPTPDQSQEIEATLGEGNLEIKVGI